MSPSLAAVVFAMGIGGLFVLDWDPRARTSKALWIPVLWFLIIGSRPVSQWLQMGPVVDSPDATLDGSPLDALVFGVLMSAGFVVLLARRQQVGKMLRSNGPLILFFFYCCISVFWSDFPLVAFKRWTKGVADLSMILIVLTEVDASAAIKRLMARMGFLLLPVSLLLIKYYEDLGRGYDRWEGTIRYTGVTTNKNTLGVICLVSGLGALWRFIESYRNGKSAVRTKQLIAQGFLLGLALWLLWLTNSMTSLSCFAMAGSLIVLTSVPAVSRSRAMIHVLVGGLLIVASSPLFLALGSGFVQMLGRDPTLTGRTEIWNLVLSLAGNPFLGTGYESFWLGQRLEKASSAFYYTLNEAHNGYLEIYLNLGWVGVAALAAIAVKGYRDILRSIRQGQDAAKVRLAFFFVALAYSVTEAGFRMMSPTWILFLLAVTAIPTASSPPTASEWHAESWRPRPMIVNPVEAKANEPIPMQ
jgi:exopolysaccharide production protein ExoQ